MALAQEVASCDWRSSAASIVEPWEEYSRTFSDGKVRIALMDTLEPAASAVHILILSPPYDELGARQCRVLSHHATSGFSNADFWTLDPTYDPAVGLIFEIAVEIMGAIGPEDRTLRFTLNQATGGIGASLQ
ncbi:hypothetical protein [Roseovarius sp. THAF8]|uniref:hypothetical protein n=1 Tax=Roseovarius sp. THAF8 TaxID=2587846 RepID=UPI0012682CC2|nr:hypothetical protein [Roseovarius sp. THAF8]